MLIFKDLNGVTLAAVDHTSRTVWSLKPVSELLQIAANTYKVAKGNEKYNASIVVEAVRKYHYREHYVQQLPQEVLPPEYYIG